MNKTHALLARSVTKRFGGLVAVSNLGLEVKAGEIHGLIGPNGAGKSTFLNLLSGIIIPDQGKIVWNGVDITDMPAFRRARLGIGRTFQNSQAFPAHTVYENIIAGARGGVQTLDSLVSWKVDEGLARDAHRILEEASLIDYKFNYPNELNNLQQQKLSICMNLIKKPEIILLDEPSGGLIEAEVKEISRYLRAINSGGISLLLVDHKMSLVSELCDMVTVMASGRHLATNFPAQVFAQQEVREAYLGEANDE